MTNVILQPASGVEPREHYQLTVENLVSLSGIRDHLATDAYEALATAVGTDSTCVWGMRPSSANRWRQIQVGDKVIFAKENRFFSLSTVTWKTNSHALAIDLWGFHDSGDTWEYIYFFGPPEDIDIPYADINAVAGYSPRYVPQGVNVLSSAKAQAVIEMLSGANTPPIASQRQFGSIPNHPVGSLFTNRTTLSRSRVHRPMQAGISGSKTEGADSIVIDHGYPDDEDYGNNVIYTGQGGQNSIGRRFTEKQVRDQEITNNYNWALKISYEEKLPIRVTRGPHGDPEWSPSTGYRYDGLYLVARYWREKGIDGYRIWRYHLERIDQSAVIEPEEGGPVGRTSVTSDRQIRDSALALKLKEEYDFTCQICRIRLDSPSGPYPEAAHIKPLGRPDDGPDIKTNMLCLCPNHHKLMDCGGIVIDDNYRIIQVLDGKQLGFLEMSSRHRVSQEYLSWHKARWEQTQMVPNG
jgi:putative restriction endonuclease